PPRNAPRGGGLFHPPSVPVFFTYRLLTCGVQFGAVVAERLVAGARNAGVRRGFAFPAALGVVVGVGFLDGIPRICCGHCFSYWNESYERTVIVCMVAQLERFCLLMLQMPLRLQT